MTIEEELAAANKKVGELETELRAALKKLEPAPANPAGATARQVEILTDDLRAARKELADLRKWREEKEPKPAPKPEPTAPAPTPAPRKKDWAPWDP